MHRLGGGVPRNPPYKKALENRYRVDMHVKNQIFQGQLIEKKIRSITFFVWGLGRVEKNAKKRSKNEEKKIFSYTL